MKSKTNRREFIKALGLGAASFAVSGCISPAEPATGTTSQKKPNFVVIFCDDLGYGDVGC